MTNSKCASTLVLFLMGAVVPLHAQNRVVSVTDYGAIGDGTHATENRTAFANAFTAAGSEGSVLVPPGTYALDNSSGALTISGFDGELRFEGNSRLSFTNNTASGIAFSGGWGTRVTAFHSIYATNPGSFVSGTSALTFGGTINLRLTNAIIQGSPGNGILISGALEPQVRSIEVSGTQGAGIDFVNSRDLVLSDATVTGSSSEGVVFHTDSGVTGRDGANASNITVTSGSRGIAADGGSNITISGFRVNGTSSSAVYCGQNGNSGAPSNVSFNGGVISGPQGYGIEVNAATRCNFSEVEVVNGANKGVQVTAPQGVVSLQGIRVSGIASADAFDFSDVDQVNISDSSAENCGGYGFFFDTVSKVVATGLTTLDVSKSSALHRAVWLQNSTAITAMNLTVADDQSSATGFIVGSTAITHGNMQNIASAFSNGSLLVQNPASVITSQVH